MRNYYPCSIAGITQEPEEVTTQLDSADWLTRETVRKTKWTDKLGHHHHHHQHYDSYGVLASSNWMCVFLLMVVTHLLDPDDSNGGIRNANLW